MEDAARDDNADYSDQPRDDSGGDAAAFGVGLVATALIHLLLLSTPAPFTFFGWIMGLCTLAAVVAPFATDADLAPKISTAIINAIIGIAIWNLTASSGHRSLSPPPEGAE